jgi:anti-anti-sigma factor
MQNGEYLYSWHNDACVIKLTGSLSYAESGDFACFIDKLFESTPPPAIVIDLSETSSLDSTNLGLLAKIARTTLEQDKQKTVMISPKPDINRVLKSMGFDKVFTIVQDSYISPNPQEKPSKIPNKEMSEHELARTVLESHRTLMELNENNRETFKNVVQFLEREIKN